GGLLGILLVARSPSPASPPVPQREDVRSFASPTGGFRFSYPASWVLTERGEVGVVERSGGGAVVSVGPAPEGDPGRAARRLLSAIRRTYADVFVTGIAPLPSGDRTAVVVGGTARNRHGALLRFRLLVVGSGGRNHAIAIFADRAASGAAWREAELVVRSFSAIEGP
ncbi:MAG TPA: hypothetical protein VNO17_03280, partial [Actinomycetota bacterium]|nr:hypothetical protein [Actinomycetota bacterium]